MASAREIVEKFQEAIEKQDYVSVRSLFQDDLTIQGPIESFHNADTYLETLKRLAANVQRVDIKRIFVGGDDVCLLYDMTTNTPVGTISVANWYQVTDNKISSLRTVYDTLPFARMVGR